MYLNDSVRKKGVAEVFKMCYNRDRILKYNMRAKKQKESGSASGTAEKWILIKFRKRGERR